MIWEAAIYHEYQQKQKLWQQQLLHLVMPREILWVERISLAGNFLWIVESREILWVGESLEMYV